MYVKFEFLAQFCFLSLFFLILYSVTHVATIIKHKLLISIVMYITKKKNVIQQKQALLTIF